MPTSLFSEMDRGANGGGTASLEDQRALQLALELSMLGLEGTPGCPGTGTGTGTGTANDPDPLQTTPPGVFEEARSKKSQNMTECVPVPSSEHVAEIVGRQGVRLSIARAIDRSSTPRSRPASPPPHLSSRINARARALAMIVGFPKSLEAIGPDVVRLPWQREKKVTAAGHVLAASVQRIKAPTPALRNRKSCGKGKRCYRHYLHYLFPVTPVKFLPSEKPCPVKTTYARILEAPQTTNEIGQPEISKLVQRSLFSDIYPCPLALEKSWDKERSAQQRYNAFVGSMLPSVQLAKTELPQKLRSRRSFGFKKLQEARRFLVLLSQWRLSTFSWGTMVGWNPGPAGSSPVIVQPKLNPYSGSYGLLEPRLAFGLGVACIVRSREEGTACLHPHD
ncbi:RNA-binding protein MEX3B [Eufriesea mexicana]|uniref:RNA-binding protein MEX3B n=1 Tax=Eufriesea mexicana TaxID=516756 RepID=A0A310SEE0_9HYME|nr:RNA-binding protein MEX3B [Eufriesea mexicana]